MSGYVKGLYAWLGVRTPFDPQSRFVTSYLLPPIWLFVWRTLISLYTLVTIILVYALSGGAKEFSYLYVCMLLMIITRSIANLLSVVALS